MGIPFRKIENPQTHLVTVTAFHPERGLVDVKSTHPSFDNIVTALQTGDPAVWELFDVASGIMQRFRSITDRVSFDGENILFDGDVVHSALAGQVRRALESGSSDYEALAKFWEKLASNPNEHSRAQAYDWLATHDFKITPEGNLVAYKGVNTLGDGNYASVSSGTAWVNGEIKRGQIVQTIGDEVTMPRSEVAHDPAVACHYGLHVGDWSYASGFADTVLEIHVNPRDICSVPTDCGARKMRTCKYKVVAEITSEYAGKAPVLSGAATGWAGSVGYMV